MSYRIKMFSSEIALMLVKELNKLPCDVNLYDGKIAFDAKSVLSIMALDFSKTFILEFVTDDPELLKKINEVIYDYKA